MLSRFLEGEKSSRLSSPRSSPHCSRRRWRIALSRPFEATHQDGSSGERGQGRRGGDRGGGGVVAFGGASGDRRAGGGAGLLLRGGAAASQAGGVGCGE